MPPHVVAPSPDRAASASPFGASSVAVLDTHRARLCEAEPREHCVTRQSLVTRIFPTLPAPRPTFPAFFCSLCLQISILLADVNAPGDGTLSPPRCHCRVGIT